MTEQGGAGLRQWHNYDADAFPKTNDDTAADTNVDTGTSDDTDADANAYTGNDTDADTNAYAFQSTDFLSRQQTKFLFLSSSNKPFEKRGI